MRKIIALFAMVPAFVLADDKPTLNEDVLLKHLTMGFGMTVYEGIEDADNLRNMVKYLLDPKAKSKINCGTDGYSYGGVLTAVELNNVRLEYIDGYSKQFVRRYEPLGKGCTITTEIK